VAKHPVSDEPGDRRGQSREEHRRPRRSRPGQASDQVSLDSLPTVAGQKGKNALCADFQAGELAQTSFWRDTLGEPTPGARDDAVRKGGSPWACALLTR
jgi:hypothetical protein